MPNTIEAPRHPTAASSGTPTIATTTVPTLPPAMWALIGEAVAVRRELLRQQAVADGVLRRATDARDDVRHRERQEARGQRLDREPATEQQAADAQQRSPREPSRQLGVGQLDHARGEGPERRQERDLLHVDAEFLDERQEDQRQQHRLGVVDRVPEAEQDE